MVRQSYTLHSVPPNISSITTGILCSYHNIDYFLCLLTSPWLFCNYQSYFLIPLILLTIPPTPLPSGNHHWALTEPSMKSWAIPWAGFAPVPLIALCGIHQFLVAPLPHHYFSPPTRPRIWHTYLVSKGQEKLNLVDQQFNFFSLSLFLNWTTALKTTAKNLTPLFSGSLLKQWNVL